MFTQVYQVLALVGVLKVIYLFYGVMFMDMYSLSGKITNYSILCLIIIIVLSVADHFF